MTEQKIEIIKINDIEYVKKEEYDKIKPSIVTIEKVKRFNSDEEADLLKFLGQIFRVIDTEKESTISEEDAVKNGIWIKDVCHIYAINGKSERAKRLLAKFVASTRERENMTEMDFIQREGLPACTAVFSLEYLSKIINFFGIFGVGGEKVRVSLKYNHPIKIENSDFAFILAPRIGSEEESE